ncbi:MAG: iron ABC transporter permease [Microthrixaceae bacterium]|nr:iron ABC transporter permease [Microthrixaceae bacterium]
MARRDGVNVRIRAAALLLVALPAAFLLLSSGWPLVALVARSLRGSGWSELVDALGNARIGRLAVLTAGQAALSAAIAVMVGVPCAYCHARFEMPGRRLLWALVAVPFVLPTVVVAAAVGRVERIVGLEGDTGTWATIIAAHVIVNVAVVVRTVGVRLAAVDPSVEEAARLAGRSPLVAAWCAVRVAGESVLSAAVVVFLFCATSFGIVAVLGGGSVSTIEIEIWFQTTQLLRLDVAALLSVVQMVVVGAVVAVLLRPRQHRGTLVSTRPRRCPRGVERAVVAAAAVVQVLVAAGPLLVLLIRSLQVGGGWGLDHYRNLGDTLEGTGLAVGPWQATLASLQIAMAATSIALVVGALAASAVAVGVRGARVLDAALLIPLATSAATVGFGILIAYSGPPLDLRGSWWALPVVEAAIAAPLVARALVPVFGDIDRRQLDAAATLGASGWRRLREVVLPAVRPALGVAAGLAFAVSLGEFGATAFLARSGSPTLPQLMVRLLGRPGEANLGQAMAVGVLMAVLTAGVFALAEALGRGRALEF